MTRVHKYDRKFTIHSTQKNKGLRIDQTNILQIGYTNFRAVDNTLTFTVCIWKKEISHLI